LADTTTLTQRLFKVGYSRVQKDGIILECPQALITGGAKNPANPTRHVAMVYEPRGFSAYGTHAVLFFHHSIKVFHRQPVKPLISRLSAVGSHAIRNAGSGAVFFIPFLPVSFEQVARFFTLGASGFFPHLFSALPAIRVTPRGIAAAPVKRCKFLQLLATGAKFPVFNWGNFRLS
jgi:hypothetical protein